MLYKLGQIFTNWSYKQMITEFVIRGPSGIMYLKQNQNKVD